MLESGAFAALQKRQPPCEKYNPGNVATSLVGFPHAQKELRKNLIDDESRPPSLKYDEWRSLLRSICGNVSPEDAKADAFVGWLRPESICGFSSVEFGYNALRIERTQRDARLDGREDYAAVFHFAGRSAVSQNNQVVELLPSDLVLLDSSRPITFHATELTRQVSVRLPRQALVSHLGFEPGGGLWSRGTVPGRLLFQLALGSMEGEKAKSTPAGDAHMQLAVYDLFGALFAPSDPLSVSLHTDKLFERICCTIEDCFADPDLGPCEVAAEAGISLRYLQKLFTDRGSTCSHFIQSLRLDHAARLLQRRALLEREQPLGEIAYACGFHDYSYFVRKFRRRFGYPPGAHARGHGRNGGNGTDAPAR